MEAVQEITRPEVILRELQRIKAEHDGVITPRIIVEVARNTDSPLHDRFDWDDSEAAQKWRLEQARQLLRVRVTMEVTPSLTVKVNGFVSLPADRKNGEGYRELSDVLKSPDLKSQLLSMARSDARMFRNKYKTLAELMDVNTAISRFLGDEESENARPA